MAVVAMTATLGALAQPNEAVTAIRSKAVVDVENGRLIEGAVVVIRGNRIEAVGADVQIPEGATIIDLSDKYVLPGLIDAHTHELITPDYASNNPILYKSIPYRTIEGVAAARATLLAGFTTIRDIDSEGADWADIALRDAIEDGLVMAEYRRFNHNSDHGYSKPSRGKSRNISRWFFRRIYGSRNASPYLCKRAERQRRVGYFWYRGLLASCMVC